MRSRPASIILTVVFMLLSTGTGAFAPAYGLAPAPFSAGQEIDLAALLPTPRDLPREAMLVMDEGGPGDDVFASAASDWIVAAHSRSFVAEGETFLLGESPLFALQTSAMDFGTVGMASRVLGLIDILDIPTLFRLGIAMDGDTEDFDLGEVVAIPAAEFGDGGFGLVAKVITPDGRFAMGLAVFRVGRVALGVTAMGLEGIRGEDLTPVMSTLAKRAALASELHVDLPGEDGAGAELEFSVVDSVGIALDEIVLSPADFPEAGAIWELTDDGGTPMLMLALLPNGPSFSTGSGSAVAVMAAVSRFPTSEEAREEHGTLAVANLWELWVNMSGLEDWEVTDEDILMFDLIVGDEPPALSEIDVSLGEGGNGRAFSLEGVVRADIEFLSVLQGEFLLMLAVARPAGEANPQGSVELIERMYENLRRVTGGG